MALTSFGLTLLLAGFPAHAVAAATAQSTASAQTASGGLEGTAWRAVELAGTPVPAQSPADREPHLVFGAGGRVSGADGCNRLTGPYTVKENGITFGQLAGTQMACPRARRLHVVFSGP
jgi:heat shock protein HslJ